MAEIIEMPVLFLAESEVRFARQDVDRCQHIIDTGGEGLPKADIAVAMAECMLTFHLENLRKAEAALASVKAGSALTYNGVVYSTTEGRA